MSPHEKRASTRYEVVIAMTVTRDGESTPARMINLSLGGALVQAALEPELEVGQKIEISFPLPDLDQPLQAKAVVRWEGNPNQSEFGIQFMTGFRAKETWALGRFLERQPRI